MAMMMSHRRPRTTFVVWTSLNNSKLTQLLFVVVLSSHTVFRFARARVVSGDAQLDGVRTEHEIAKFAYPPGRHSVQVEATLLKGETYPAGSPLRLYAYEEAQYPEVLKAPTCREKIRFASWSQPVVWRMSQKHSLGHHGRQRYQKTTNERPKTMLKREIIAPGPGTRIWYFTFADCSLEEYYHVVPRMSYTVDLRLGDGTHLPVFERGMGALHFLNVLASASIVLFLVTQVVDLRKKDRVPHPHVAVVALGVAASLDALSSLFELYHVRSYARNGVGSYVCDAFAAMCEASCDACIAALLLCIGAGWTLRGSLSSLDDDDHDGASSSKRQHANKDAIVHMLTKGVAPVASMLRYPAHRFPTWVPFAFLLFHLLLAQWSRMYDDDFDTFHDFEHMPGRILAVSRLFGACLFVPVVLRSQSAAGEKLRRFYVKWCAVGTMWFLHLPTLCVFAGLFIKPYLRHRVVSGLSALWQTSALFLLALLFMGKTSTYFHSVSTVGQGDANLDAFSFVDSSPSLSSSSSNRGSSGADETGFSSSAARRRPAKLPSVKVGGVKIRLD